MDCGQDPLETGEVVFENSFSNSKWMAFMPKGHVTLDNVMFAPLKIDGKAYGLIGLANKPGGFIENDARMATEFGMKAIHLLLAQLIKIRRG